MNLKTKSVLFVGLVFLILLFGCIEPEVQGELDGLKFKVSALESDLLAANNKIIELQEDSKYGVEELRKARDKKRELQLVYNSLNGDFQSCYFANFCFSDPVGCVQYFDDGYSAAENHKYYSNLCSAASRDWSKYVGYDTDLTPEIS